MNNLVTVTNGNVFVNSYDVSSKFGKEHRNLMRNIRSLIKSQPEFGALNFERSNYTTSQNKTHECFNMTRDGFCMIAMSLTGREAEQWKIKYINAFNSMESAIKALPPTMDTMNEIVKKAESDKKIASALGAGLANYKKVKKQNEEAFDKAAKQVQTSLGFVK